MKEINHDYLSEDLQNRFGTLDRILTIMEKDNDFDANQQIKFNKLSDCLLVRSTIQRYLKSTHAEPVVVDHTQPEHAALLAKVHWLLTDDQCFDEDGFFNTLSADDKLQYAELLDTLFTSQNRMIKMGNTFWACLGTVGSVGNVVCSFGGLKYSGAVSKAGSLLAKFIGNKEFNTIAAEEMKCFYDKETAFDLAHLENLSTDAYRYVIESYIQSLKEDIDQCESITEININISLMQESIRKLQMDVDLNLQKSQSCYVSSDDQKKNKLFKFRRDIFKTAVKTTQVAFDLYEHQQQNKISKIREGMSLRKLEEQLHRTRASLNLVDPSQYMKDPMSYAIYIGQSMHYGLEEQFVDSKNQLGFLYDKLDMLKDYAEKREEFGEKLEAKHEAVAHHQDKLIDRLRNFHTTHLFKLAHNVLNLTGDINMICSKSAGPTPVGMTLHASAICCQFADKTLMYKHERKRLNLEECLDIYNTTAQSYQTLIQHNASNKQFLQSQLQQVSSSILQERAATQKQRIQALRNDLKTCEENRNKLLKQEAKANEAIQNLKSLKDKRRFDEGRYFLAGKDGKAEKCKAEITRANAGIQEQNSNLLNIAQGFAFLDSGKDQCKHALKQQVVFAPYQTIYNAVAMPRIDPCEDNDDEEYNALMENRSDDVSEWLKNKDNVAKLRGELTREIQGFVYLQQTSIKLVYQSAAGIESVAMPIIDILNNTERLDPEKAKKLKENIQFITRNGPRLYEGITHAKTISLTVKLMSQAYRDHGSTLGMLGQVGTMNIVAGVINPGLILLGLGLSLYSAYHAKEEKSLQIKLYESTLESMFEYTKQIMNTMNLHFESLKNGQEKIIKLIKAQDHHFFSLETQKAVEAQQKILKQRTKSKKRLNKAVQHQKERNFDNADKNALLKSLSKLKVMSKSDDPNEKAIQRELLNVKVSGKKLFKTMYDKVEQQPGEYIRNDYVIALPMSSHTEQEFEIFRSKLHTLLGNDTPSALQKTHPSLFLQKVMATEFTVMISKLRKHANSSSTSILQDKHLQTPLAKTISATLTIVKGLEQFLEKGFFILAALQIIENLVGAYKTLLVQIEQKTCATDEKYKQMGALMNTENRSFLEHMKSLERRPEDKSGKINDKSWYELLIEAKETLWVGKKKFRVHNFLTRASLYAIKVETVEIGWFSNSYKSTYTYRTVYNLITDQRVARHCKNRHRFVQPGKNDRYKFAGAIGDLEISMRLTSENRKNKSYERHSALASIASPFEKAKFRSPDDSKQIITPTGEIDISSHLIHLDIKYNRKSQITIQGNNIEDKKLKSAHDSINESMDIDKCHNNFFECITQYISEIGKINLNPRGPVIKDFKINQMSLANPTLMLPNEKGFLPLLLPQKARLNIIEAVKKKFKIPEQSSFLIFNNLWFTYSFLGNDKLSSYELFIDVHHDDKMIFHIPLATFDKYTVDCYRTYAEEWSFEKHNLSPYMEFIFIAWYGVLFKDNKESAFQLPPLKTINYPGLASHQSVQLTDDVYCPAEIPFVGLCNLLSSQNTHLSNGFYFIFNHEQYNWKLAEEYFKLANAKDDSFELSDAIKEQLLPHSQIQATSYLQKLLDKAYAYHNFICRLAFSQFEAYQFNQVFEYYDMIVTLLKLFSGCSKENSQVAIGSCLGVASPEHLYKIIENDQANTITPWITSQIDGLSSINKNDFADSLLFFRNPNNTRLKEERLLLKNITQPQDTNMKGKKEEDDNMDALQF